MHNYAYVDFIQAISTALPNALAIIQFTPFSQAVTIMQLASIPHDTP